MVDFSSKNFKEFCEKNKLNPEQGRNILFSEINRLFFEISKLKQRSGADASRINR